MQSKITNTQRSPLLTESELIQWLRLDEPGGPKNPSATIKFYRQRGLLKGVRIGRHLRYPLAEAERFVERLVEREERR